MRKADLYVAAILAFFSVYLMVKSADLPIGIIKGEGPGGGAFPFWLAAGMLICSVLIFIRTYLRISPEGKSTEIFMSREAYRLITTVTIALTIMIGMIHIVGMYVAIPLFMVYYIRQIGAHSWLIALAMAITSAVMTFTLFEKILVIPLPKGLLEPLFYVFFT